MKHHYSEKPRTIADVIDLPELGGRIQALRSERGMTLQELADRSKVSVSMLSSVERALKAPTVIVLDRIADGLGVSLTRLLTDPAPARVVVRRADRQDTAAYPSGWHRTILSPVVPGVNFELVRVTLPAGCDAGDFPAYAPGSHEYITVESGEVRVTVGDQAVDLAAGDSLYFAADVAHAYANHTGEPATYYVAALVMRSRA